MAVLGPRAQAGAVSTQSFATHFRRAVADMLVGRADCDSQSGGNLCEKPGSSSKAVTWIVVGTVFGLVIVASLSVLAFLHMRRRKRDKAEDKEDRFQMSDYGLDERPAGGNPRMDGDMKWSHNGSPNPDGRRSRDPLHAGTEPKYPPGAHANGHLDPFDDRSSFRTGNGSSYPPSVDPQWPKRESSQTVPKEER